MHMKSITHLMFTVNDSITFPLESSFHLADGTNTPGAVNNVCSSAMREERWFLSAMRLGVMLVMGTDDITGQWCQAGKTSLVRT